MSEKRLCIFDEKKITRLIAIYKQFYATYSKRMKNHEFSQITTPLNLPIVYIKKKRRMHAQLYSPYRRLRITELTELYPSTRCSGPAARGCSPLRLLLLASGYSSASSPP